jgi:hypothetical protein
MWYRDPEAWRVILARYLPWLAGLNLALIVGREGALARLPDNRKLERRLTFQRWEG